MKKVISSVLLLCIVFTLAVTPVFAEMGIPTNGVATSSNVTPRWVNTVSIGPRMSPSTGTYGCSIVGLSGTSNTTATAILYEKGFFGYSEVARVSNSTNSNVLMMSGSYSFKSGKNYLLSISGTVTKDGYAESVSDSLELTA